MTIKSRIAPFSNEHLRKIGLNVWLVAGIVTIGIASALVFGSHLAARAAKPSAAAASLQVVTVATPMQRELSEQLQFLGQFSAIDRVELRAQVGGTLTKIGFKDGAMVRQGDFLFEIDPTPYEIKVSEATAQLASARARLELASQELSRAETLKQTDAGSVENVEQRSAEKLTAKAAVEAAEALLRDARFDLERCRISAPFTGRMGSHLVSVGNLISGSRTGNGPTTLLATLVSLNPIYLNFDMSEADYMAFLREREKHKGPLADKIDAALSDEPSFTRQGTLNFVDNSLDRSSGTIHARATMANADLLLTPGAFARVRLELSTPFRVLLIPDTSVLPDQSEHFVLTVGSDDVVVAKKVETGDLREGLRVVRSGLSSSDRVVVGGVPVAAPGSKVSVREGSIQSVPSAAKSRGQS